MIRCLEKDVPIVEQAIPIATKAFADLVKAELGKDFKVDLKVDKAHYLVERTLKDNSGIDVSDYSMEMG
jgi:hypothetical protein